MKKITFLFCLFCAFPALACMNEVGIMALPGVIKPKLNDWELELPTVRSSVLREYVTEMEANCSKSLTDTCSNIAIAYFYLGEYKKALELTTRLVKKFPAKYEVVMTHASALELNGQFAEALKYIRKGMRINPDSHFGSEWIHVRILEDLIKGGNGSVLGLEFGQGNEPVLPAGVDNKRRLMAQLHYQLKERFYFMPKDDQQFARLLYDYANLLYLNNFNTVSRHFYALAEQYGYEAAGQPSLETLPPLPEKRFEEEAAISVNSAPKAKPKPGTSPIPALFIGTVVVIVLAGRAYSEFSKTTP